MLFSNGRSKGNEVYCDKRQCLRSRFGYEFLRVRTQIEGYRNMVIEPGLFAELC